MNEKNDELKLVDSPSQDEAFLFDLFVSTKKAEFDFLPITEMEMGKLLQIQYHAQKKSYHDRFPNAKNKLIMYRNVRTGRVVLEKQTQHVHLIDIALLPAYMGKGFGTNILRRIQESAKNEGLSILLHVFSGNPAQRLYERCGFRVVDEVTPYVAMRWEASNR